MLLCPGQGALWHFRVVVILEYQMLKAFRVPHSISTHGQALGRLQEKAKFEDLESKKAPITEAHEAERIKSGMPYKQKRENYNEGLSVYRRIRCEGRSICLDMEFTRKEN